MKTLVTLALAIASLLPGVARADVVEKPIQPGAQMTGPAGCTFNFVFTDPDGGLYIGTAGHCTGAVGDLVTDTRGQTGVVIYRTFVGVGTDDFSLIEINRWRYDDVSPQMRRWGGPTASTTFSETARNDLLYFNGYGMAFGSTPVTRPRPGLLQEDNARTWFANAPIIYGDSGGPVLHASGKALGVVSGINGTSMVGTTIERIMEMLAQAAFGSITLATAPFEGL